MIASAYTYEKATIVVREKAAIVVRNHRFIGTSIRNIAHVVGEVSFVDAGRPGTVAPPP